METIVSPAFRNEKSLHSALKSWYAEPGDRLEAKVDGYYIDIVRDNLLIEVQTRSFSKIKTKISCLLPRYALRLVYPVVFNKWIRHIDPDGNQVRGPRLSPKHQKMESLFHEFVHLASLAVHDNFSLQLIGVEEEEIQVLDGKGSWRRKGRSIQDHRLLRVMDTLLLESVGDYLSFLPSELPDQFSSRSLAKFLKITPDLSRRMLYSFRQMGIIQLNGKSGRQYIYSRCPLIESSK